MSQSPPNTGGFSREDYYNDTHYSIFVYSNVYRNGNPEEPEAILMAQADKTSYQVPVIDWTLILLVSQYLEKV